jgi:serpin B
MIEMLMDGDGVQKSGNDSLDKDGGDEDEGRVGENEPDKDKGSGDVKDTRKESEVADKKEGLGLDKKERFDQPQSGETGQQKSGCRVCWLLVLILVMAGLVGGGYWLVVNGMWDVSSVPVIGEWLGIKPVEKPIPVASPDIRPTDMPGAKPTLSSEVGENPVSEAHNQFGFEVFKALFEQQPADFKNLFISPSSIALALSMTYNGAGGDTKQAMAKTLHFDQLSDEQINQVSKQLMERLENGSVDPQVTMEVANSIWAREGVAFKADFVSTNQSYYDAQVSAIDFGLDSAADMINTWVSEQTKGKIPTIVQMPIPDLVMMYLINAIYFKGTWTYEFDPELTEERGFTALPEESLMMHPMMNQEREDFSYLESDSFQAVKLPYGESQQYFMYVWLPKDSVSEFIDQLSKENWDRWLTGFAKQEGTLWLPKFKLEYEEELKEVLSDLGMGVAFSGLADFSRMSSEVELMISKVLHKTFVEVNEEGTEAAAVTSVEMMATSVGDEPERFYMEVNKPFVLMIVDEETGEMVFMGLVRMPEV